MMPTAKTYEQLLQENLKLQARLDEAEETLRAIRSDEEDLARLGAIVMSSSDAIISETLAGIITSWNAGAEHIFGYTAQEVIGKPITMLIPPDRQDEEKALLEKIAVGDTIKNYDTIRLKKDGSEVFILVSLSAIKDKQGKIISVSKIAQDITEHKRAEEELRRTNELLERVFATTDFLIAYLDTEFNFIRVNRVYAEKDGRTPEFFPGKNHFDLYPNEENEAIFRHTLETGETYTAIAKPFVYAEHPERGVTYWNWILQPVKEQEGLITGLIFTLLDVTKREKAEQALRAASAYNRRLIEASLDPLVTIASDGKITDVNAATEAVTGFTRQELIGTDFSNYFTEPDKARAGYQEVFRSDLVRDYPLELQHRDGHVTSVLYNASVYRDEDGQVIGVFAAARDITERKRAEEELRRYAARLAAINRLDRTIASNLDIAQVYSNFVGELQNLIKPLDRTSIVRLDETCQRWHVARQWTRGKPAFRIGEWRPVKGSVFEWLVTNRRPYLEPEIGEHEEWPETALLREEKIRSRLLLPLIFQERVIGALTVSSRQPRAFSQEDLSILTTIADYLAVAVQNSTLYEQIRRHATELGQRVTERTTQLEAANKELEAFSYSVSHDLRAPLRAIDGFSHIMLEEYAPELPPDAQRYLRIVRENAQRMGRLIDDLLTFSRLSRQPLNKQSVDLVPLVQDVFNELRATETERTIDLTIGDLPICNAAPALLRQVFANLLENALKFTRKREVTLIEVGCDEQNGEMVYFVKDNGVGFDMQYANKLFGVFQRLHRAEDYEGTGVGLATVQRIVNRHGGRIWTEAEVDKGAIFYFTLGGETPNDQ